MRLGKKTPPPMGVAVIVHEPESGPVPPRGTRRPGKRVVVAGSVAALLAWPAVRAARAHWNPPPPELDPPVPPTRADPERPPPRFDLAPGPLAGHFEPREPMEMPHKHMRDRTLPQELTGYGNFGTRPRHPPEE
jgi:hypothetical protein